MCKKLIFLVSFVFVLCSAWPSPAEAADPDLVGWWRFDEGSGTTASDSSGYGNDGTLGGNATWDAGLYGGSLYVDGSAWVDINPAAWDPIERQVTVAFWAFGGEAMPVDNFAFGAYSADDNAAREASAHLPWGNENVYWDTGGTGYDRMQQLLDDESIYKGNWTHWAFTKDCDTGEMHIYINGELWHSATGMTLTMTGVIQFTIGTRGTTDHAEGYIGWIDDFRIYNRALTEAEIQKAMLGMPLGLASEPSPGDGATDVSRDVVLSWEPGEFAAPTNGHKVYLGESFNDVNDATGGVAQSDNSYTRPQRLDFNTTYYWRVDEVNAPPTSHIEFKGEVWSFTTEPIAYPIDGNNITATASSTQQADTGPENTNGPGLDVNDLHSTQETDMWLSGSEPNGAWIEYELDKVYKLHEMWVWNSNGTMEPMIGFGFKDVAIEYSVNGTDYTTLGTTHEFARASGTSDYAHNTTVDFGSAAAKYVRLTANSNWGGILTQYGLSEVRFFSIPVFAREPSPDSGTTDVDVDVTLGFRAGREAAEHNVYLSSDEQAVIDGNAPVTTVTEASDGPLSLDLGTTYYWKINEVNEAETTTMWQGDIWNFSTHEYFVVDDFEDYNDYPPNEIWSTWIDGYGIQTNGATVGYPSPDFLAGEHYVETANVHGGEQAMPFFYDNTGGATYSEGERTFAVLQDWTKAGVQTLALYFRGSPGNTGQLYVKANGSKVVYDGDAADMQRAGWQAWNIEVASFGTNLQSVTTLAIGIDDNGASGTLYFDEIRRYPYSRQFITPAEPNNADMLAHWKLDDGSGSVAADTSGYGHNGAIGGTPIWVAGKIGGALDFDGSTNYIDMDDRVVEGTLTLAMWLRPRDIPYSSGYYAVMHNDAWDAGALHVHLRNTTSLFNADFNSGPSVTSTTVLQTDKWYHCAVTVTTEGGNASNLYIDGVLEDTDSGGTGIPYLGPLNFGAWNNSERYYHGLMDDVRIYNYALSYGEVGWLAGRTEPFDKPF